MDGVCKKCGCTNERACPGGCYWVKPDLCSTCASGRDDEPWDPDGIVGVITVGGIEYGPCRIIPDGDGVGHILPFNAPDPLLLPER